MMRLPFFCVVALLGAAVSAPAQFSDARIARNVVGSVTVGKHDDHRHAGVRETNHGRGHSRHAVVHGHWKTVCEEVLVPGYWREQHVPPTYGWVYDSCGHRRWGIVDAGGCRRVWVPAHYETRSRRVWVHC